MAKHSPDEVRRAKQEAVTRFGNDFDVTGIGMGLTEDASDLAVTITVRTKAALSRLPRTIRQIPVRGVVSGPATKLTR